MIKSWFSLLRVSQWVKNLFVFIPVFFAGAFLHVDAVTHVAIAFVAFSLMASAVYILNDYFDIEKDRLHPEKKERPLASGLIKPSAALGVAIVLMVVSSVIAFQQNINLLYILATYLVMNVLYTVRLKHIALVDIAIIALGFLLRIFAGGVAADVPISKWLVIITFLVALFLGLAKRRDEYLIFLAGTNTRKAIEGYNLQFIDVSMVIMAGVTIVSYIMYTLSAGIKNTMDSEYTYLTTFWVVLGILRYLQITIVFEKSGSPTKVIWTDRFLQAVILGWIVSFVVLIYA